MADVFSKRKRSEVMRAIKSKNTKPEIKVRRALRKLGFFSSHISANLPGKPDVVLKEEFLVIFVHGCFWHQHRNCKVSRMPKSNLVFWKNKFNSNLKRDRRVREKLKALGWRVGVVWECETRGNVAENKLPEILTEFIRRKKRNKQLVSVKNGD